MGKIRVQYDFEDEMVVPPIGISSDCDGDPICEAIKNVFENQDPMYARELVANGRARNLRDDKTVYEIEYEFI